MSKAKSMMVVYSGSSHFRNYSAADFAKAGVEVDSDFSFPQGEPVKVPEAVAQALMDPEGIFDHMHFGEPGEMPAEEIDEGQDELNLGDL